MKETKKQLISRVNTLISQRVRLGHYIVKSTRRGYRMKWSNAYARWNIYYYADKAGIYDMDANVILVEGVTKKQICEILPYLYGLPLYGNSFEARFKCQ